MSPHAHDALVDEVARLERQVRELRTTGATVAGLEKLLLARQRLDACHDRAEVVEALRDVVATLLGADDFALLAFDDAGRTLWPILGVGPTGSACGPLLAVDALVARALRTGQRVVDTDRSRPCGSGAEALACVPLVSGAAICGVLVIFSLVKHREELDRADLDLLDLLGAQAANAFRIADARAGAATLSLL